MVCGRRTRSSSDASFFFDSFSAFFARPDSFFAFPPFGGMVLWMYETESSRVGSSCRHTPDQSCLSYQTLDLSQSESTDITSCFLFRFLPTFSSEHDIDTLPSNGPKTSSRRR